GSSPIVLHAKSGKITDSKYANGINQAAKNLSNNPNVGSVISPITSQGAGQVSKDQTIGYFSVALATKAGNLSLSEAEGIVNDANPAQAAGLEVETGGQLGQQVSKTGTESSEAIGILAAILILTFTFGTVVAMALPI